MKSNTKVFLTSDTCHTPIDIYVMCLKGEERREGKREVGMEEERKDNVTAPPEDKTSLHDVNMTYCKDRYMEYNPIICMMLVKAVGCNAFNR